MGVRSEGQYQVKDSTNEGLPTETTGLGQKVGGITEGKEGVLGL